MAEVRHDLDALAAVLAAARIGGGLAAACPALDLAQGYAVAGKLADRLGRGIGWKIGATSPGAQSFLKVAEPIRGRLYGCWHDGAVVITPGDRPVEVEPEIIVRLGDGLEPVAAWVGVEFNRPSFADPFALGVGAIVADNAASLGVLIGPSLPLAALEAPERLTARLRVDGAVVGEGRADAVLGDPRRALDWLERALAGTPDALRPGDLVATGAMCRSAAAPRGARVEVEADGHGRGSVLMG